MRYERRGSGIFYLLISIIFGLYFLNYPSQFVNIPESFGVAEPWIIFLGGILIILGGINYFRLKRNPLV